MTHSWLVGLGLALILLVPPALKWELRMDWVIPWAVFVGMAAGALVGRIYPGPIWSWPAIALTACFVLFLSGMALAWRFFRDPDRVPPKEDQAILAPADGIVLYINPFEKGEVPGGRKKKGQYNLKEFTQTNLFNNGGWVVGIGMSFLDVHVNRAPVGGRVTFYHHIPGKFLSLKKPEALTLNERALTIIQRGGHSIGVVQIASRLVRCIVSYVEPGAMVEPGQRIGMIKFGSQVDLILPNDLQVEFRVQVGQQVYAGQTVIGVCRTQA